MSKRARNTVPAFAQDSMRKIERKHEHYYIDFETEINTSRKTIKLSKKSNPVAVKYALVSYTAEKEPNILLDILVKTAADFMAAQILSEMTDTKTIRSDGSGSCARTREVALMYRKKIHVEPDCSVIATIAPLASSPSKPSLQPILPVSLPDRYLHAASFEKFTPSDLYLVVLPMVL